MRAGIDDGRSVRRIAYGVLVLLVATGIRIGSAGDAPVRWLTAAIFGLCALSLAWKLWSTRAAAVRASTDPLPAPPPASPPAPDLEEPAPGGPWKVYGYDRFSYEDYFVGAFDTEAEAREVVRQKLERLAKFQDESLRDDIWVEPPGSRYRLSLDE